MIPFPFADTPDRLALRWAGRPVTAGWLLEEARRIAVQLARHEVRPGDVVALWSPNSLDWVVSALGAWWAGATLAPLSARWTAHEVRRAIAPLSVKLVIQDAARPLEPLGVPVVTIDQLAGPPSAAEPPALAPDQVAALLFTSGSTGVPKAVELNWGALYAHARAVATALALGPADRWWLAMPLSHVGGLGALLRCGWSGAAAVLESKFEARRVLDEAARGQLTVASFVPTMLRAVLDELAGAPWPTGLRAAMLGGAPVPPALAERCPVALATYGLTEAGSTVTLVPPGADAETRKSCGYPLPGTRVRIVSPEGQALPAGEEGLIAVEGPGLMAGYRGREPALAPDGWLTTGDYGYLDAAGRLYVVARREDLIVSGGENVYPAEVEFALLEHPAIAAAAVVGAPHPRWGESPVAFVVAASGPQAPETLDAHLASRLASFKRPKAYTWLEALPLLANGKVDRAALKTRALAEKVALEW